MVDRANAIFWVPQKHVFWIYFFLVDSSEVPEAISEMVHTFYVLPQQQVVRTGPNLFSTHFKPSAVVVAERRVARQHKYSARQGQSYSTWRDTKRICQTRTHDSNTSTRHAARRSLQSLQS